MLVGVPQWDMGGLWGPQGWLRERGCPVIPLCFPVSQSFYHRVETKKVNQIGKMAPGVLLKAPTDISPWWALQQGL